MTDEKILDKMRKRDPDGLRYLMDRYTAYVSSVVWNILHMTMTPQDAEEVVSDVFVTAWERAASIRPDKVKAWLGAVARNKAKNKFRELGKELPLEEDAISLLEVPDDLERLEREDERRLVRQALDSLSPKDREIFLRHYYYIQTVDAIAKEMRIPAATVKTRLRRGRMKLKEYLIRRDH